MVCDASAGILTAADLKGAGSSRRKIDDALRVGSLRRLRRGVYARAGTCEPVQRAAAHGGALACVSDARHRGLWVVSGADELHVALGAHGHAYDHPGCACIDHWDAAAAPPDTRFGPSSIARMLRQIWLCRGAEEFFVALESARYLRLITRSGLAWLRTSCGEIVRDAIAFSREDAESGLESLLRWRLRHTGLRLRCQVTITGVGRVDFLIGDRLILEVDGAANHDGPSHRHKDLVRDAQAAAWGYVTLRFDYALVVHDWETVLLAILGHTRAGHHHR